MEREAIMAVNAQFERYIAAGDAAGLTSLYTEDARLMPPGAGSALGREQIRDFWAAALPGLGIARLRLITFDLQVNGRSAQEVGRIEINLADGGAPAGKYIVLWRKQDDGWKLHADIWNLDG